MYAQAQTRAWVKWTSNNNPIVLSLSLCPLVQCQPLEHMPKHLENKRGKAKKIPNALTAYPCLLHMYYNL